MMRMNDWVLEDRDWRGGGCGQEVYLFWFWENFVIWGRCLGRREGCRFFGVCVQQLVVCIVGFRSLSWFKVCRKGECVQVFTQDVVLIFRGQRMVGGNRQGRVNIRDEGGRWDSIWLFRYYRIVQGVESWGFGFLF